MKQLTIEQVIKILSNNKILFNAAIYDVGEDTKWEEIEFRLEDERYTDFTFHLDLNTHGSNIQSHIDGWFFKVTTEKELFKVINKDRERYEDIN